MNKLQSKEADYSHLNAEQLKSLSIPPVNVAPHGGQITILWGKRWGLELSLEPSVIQVFISQHKQQQYVMHLPGLLVAGVADLLVHAQFIPPPPQIQQL